MQQKIQLTGLQFLAYLILTLFLMACSSTEKRDDILGESDLEQYTNYRYDAWQLNNTGEFEAINVLLDEADVLIENNAFNEAADKLERVLRIKPKYAPAWSRLSWLALEMDSPKRSVELAKRSNSFAFSDPELQVLNWSFIRSASRLLHDEDSYNRANQAMDALKAF